METSANASALGSTNNTKKMVSGWMRLFFYSTSVCHLSCSQHINDFAKGGFV